MRCAHSILLLCALSACSSPSQAPTPAATTTPSLKQVQYQLQWDRGRLPSPGADGVQELPGPDGLTWRLEQAYLVSHSAQLVPCAPSRPASSQQGFSLWSLVEGTALAGHSQVQDPSATEVPVLENILAGQSAPFGARTLPPVPYCQVHYLVARPGVSVPGAPDGVSMLKTSLLLKGEAVQGDQHTPFTLETSLANGRNFPLPAWDSLPTAADATPGDRPALRITVTRQLDTLLKDVKPADLSQPTAARQVLRNLLDDTRVTVERLP